MFKKIITAFFAVVFSALLVGCGTEMGDDLSSDMSSMLDPNMNNSAEQNNTNYSDQQSTNTSSEAKISKEKAKEIALKHANAEESKISDYEIDLDTENGVLVYEISFDYNGKEYDYDVDANTGEISNSKNELID